MCVLYIVVEGNTEDALIKELIRPHLRRFGVEAIPIAVSNSRRKRTKGGLHNYEQPKRHLQELFKQHKWASAHFSCMFDLYALPSSFPEHAKATAEPNPVRRVAILEKALSQDLAHPGDRFIPYIQLHEAEALILSRPDAFGYVFADSDARIAKLRQMSREYESPELIDGDDPPSKRIKAVFAEYNKVLHGPVIALEIELQEIRNHCKHFNAWIAKLEAIGQTEPAPSEDSS